MTYLVTAREMRKMDRRTIDEYGMPGLVLMENAARGAVEFFIETFPDFGSMKIGILAGPGNNGGDGFVMARYLFEKGADVSVFLLSAPEKVRGDARINYSLLEALDIPVHAVLNAAGLQKANAAMAHRNIWIDAALGTGLSSDVRGIFKDAVRLLNESGKPIFAVDLPSGLHADTGNPLGACIRATATATFAFAKPAHVVAPGAEYCGDTAIIDIGIPSHIVEKPPPDQILLTADAIGRQLPERLPDAHKGTSGHLLALAGSPGKTGAAVMTASAAMRSGAGLVTLGVPLSTNRVIESLSLETMSVPLAQTPEGGLAESGYYAIKNLLPGKRCLALGPGLGTAEETRRLIRRLIVKSRLPMVIDADGLNIISEDVSILERLKAPAVLTPHPGEMSRLTGLPVGEIQQDRIACVRLFAEKWQVHLVLKGAGTVIGHPNGTVHINPTGNAGMASGGMGDVLTGIIAAMITRGLSPSAAACVGVFIHGAAGDYLAEKEGPVGYLAGDVIKAIPVILARIRDPRLFQNRNRSSFIQHLADLWHLRK